MNCYDVTYTNPDVEYIQCQFKGYSDIVTNTKSMANKLFDYTPYIPDENKCSSEEITPSVSRFVIARNKCPAGYHMANSLEECACG